jgi:hypothetical protein
MTPHERTMHRIEKENRELDKLFKDIDRLW